jgi:hypothetical protein
MRSATLILLCLAVTSTANAQTRGGAVVGRVADTTDKGVAGAMVQLLGTGYATRTRDDGSHQTPRISPLTRARAPSRTCSCVRWR